MLSESAVVSFFPAVDRFLQNPWADERPQHPQLLCSENWGRVLRHSMCLPQEHMIYHHIIIIFPLKHPFGGVKMGVFLLPIFRHSHILQRKLRLALGITARRAVHGCTHCDELLFPRKSTCFRICEHRKVGFLEVPKILSVISSSFRPSANLS